MRSRLSRYFCLLPVLLLILFPITGFSQTWAEVQVVDSVTRRGIPLVELETVNSLLLVTDNTGRVAFHEPGLMNREIFFTVRSHGYEMPKDGFGFPGVRITPQPGKKAVISMIRKQVAERLCRLTGEGLYRDTQLLGLPLPLAPSKNPGMVAGQDSVQTVEFQKHIFWMWGDTQRMEYPLGLFRMAGATTPILNPADPSSNPEHGIAFDYFTAKNGFARAMMPLPERPEGVIWINAPCVVKDEQGKDTLVAHYSRRKGLADELEHGIAQYNTERAVFEVIRQLPLSETWRHPAGHPILIQKDGAPWLLFGSPNPNVRVPATLKDVLNPDQYEAFSAETTEKPKKTSVWRWQKSSAPTDSKTELDRIKKGNFEPADARFCPIDASSPKDRVVLHSGTVRWNAFRKKWVLVACQFMGKESFLGEVWYAEANDPTGPFNKAIKVATHDHQTLYNVCHHAFLDRDGGRIIHFEGTYTNDFSNNPHKTPRYNYNQVLFRLDLDDPRIQSLSVK